jgi:hypothetical protein
MKYPPDGNTYKRLAIIITTLCLATGAVAQTAAMQEQGFIPGMTEEQLRQQLKDKAAECTSGYIDGGINCRINGEEVAFAFTRGTPRRVSAITNIPAQRRSELPTVIYPKHFRPAPPSSVVTAPTPSPSDVETTPMLSYIETTPMPSPPSYIETSLTPAPWPYVRTWIPHTRTRMAPRPVERRWLTGRPRGESWLSPGQPRSGTPASSASRALSPSVGIRPPGPAARPRGSR